MKKLFVPILMMLVVGGALASAPRAQAARLEGSNHGGRRLIARLSGTNEVNSAGVHNQGAPNGRGTAVITVNPGQREVCYVLHVSGVTLPAVGAHIHAAPTGKNGPIVVPFMAPNAAGVSKGCAKVTRALALAILRNPAAYYVNVHTKEYPAGAMRGQLSK